MTCFFHCSFRWGECQIARLSAAMLAALRGVLRTDGASVSGPAALEDAPTLADARMSAYLLNPNSKKKEAAMRFLEGTAENPLLLTCGIV